jgi:hypothetical protein
MNNNIRRFTVCVDKDSSVPIQKNTEALLDAGKEVGLEVNSEKTKYMLMSRKAGQKHSTKIMHRSFESVAKFK